MIYRENKFQKLRRTSRRAKIIVLLGNFMKLLCLISIFLDKISFVTKQKSKYKVNANFIFISIEKIFWIYPKFFGENPGTNQNFIAHVL